MADYSFPSRTIKDAMKSGRLWESDIRFGYMPKNVRVVFQKGVLNYIGVPLLVSQQNTKPARPVYNNRGTGSGTLWDRYSKDLISYRYLASAAVSPKMNKILVEELIKNARVPKTKRNRIWHQSGCKCWVCNISTLRVLANTPTPPRGFPSRAYLLYQLKDYTPRT